MKKKKEKEEGMTVLTKLYGTKLRTEELHDLIWLSREYLNEIDCSKRVLPYTIVAAYLSMAFGCLAELESCYCNQTENNRLHHASSKKWAWLVRQSAVSSLRATPRTQRVYKTRLLFRSGDLFFYCWTAQINSS